MSYYDSYVHIFGRNVSKWHVVCPTAGLRKWLILDSGLSVLQTVTHLMRQREKVTVAASINTVVVPHHLSMVLISDVAEAAAVRSEGHLGVARIRVDSGPQRQAQMEDMCPLTARLGLMKNSQEAGDDSSGRQARSSQGNSPRLDSNHHGVSNHGDHHHDVVINGNGQGNGDKSQKPKIWSIADVMGIRDSDDAESRSFENSRLSGAASLQSSTSSTASSQTQLRAGGIIRNHALPTAAPPTMSRSCDSKLYPFVDAQQYAARLVGGVPLPGAAPYPALYSQYMQPGITMEGVYPSFLPSAFWRTS